MAGLLKTALRGRIACGSMLLQEGSGRRTVQSGRGAAGEEQTSARPRYGAASAVEGGRLTSSYTASIAQEKPTLASSTRSCSP